MNRTPDFDPLARIYRWMEYLTFGRALERCRCAFLAEMAWAENALLIGDGDGRFAARLLNMNRTIHIDAVDLSPAMLRSLSANAGAFLNRVSAYRADARTWQPPRSDYDVIVTHFCLDCLTTSEVSSLACRLRSEVRPESRWVVSEFAIPERWFGRVVARPLIRALYLAFRLLTGLRVDRLPDYRGALKTAGFRLARESESLSGLLVSEIWIADRPAV
jgi:ubiquinone/menaquinone biosynthesis C-methylase UbiE